MDVAMELELEDPPEVATPQITTKRRSSFFNLKNTAKESTNEMKIKYIQKLNKESQDWAELITQTMKRVKE